MVLEDFRIVAVEGLDIEDYPSLRVSDCRVLGKPYSPGSTWASSDSSVHSLDCTVEGEAPPTHRNPVLSIRRTNGVKDKVGGRMQLGNNVGSHSQIATSVC